MKKKLYEPIFINSIGEEFSESDKVICWGFNRKDLYIKKLGKLEDINLNFNREDGWDYELAKSEESARKLMYNHMKELGLKPF